MTKTKIDGIEFEFDAEDEALAANRARQHESLERYSLPCVHEDSMVLTTEHAASSYGQPVLVVDGVAYGPGDSVPSAPARIIATTRTTGPHTTAREYVRHIYRDDATHTLPALVRKFIS